MSFRGSGPLSTTTSELRADLPRSFSALESWPAPWQSSPSIVTDLDSNESVSPKRLVADRTRDHSTSARVVCRLLPTTSEVTVRTSERQIFLCPLTSASLWNDMVKMEGLAGWSLRGATVLTAPTGALYHCSA